MSLNEVGQVERHYAIVTRTQGEGSGTQGAVFFQSSTLTGDTEWPSPAAFRFPHAGPSEGMFWVPQVGDLVEIEVDVANETAVPKIIGMHYSSEDEPAEVFQEDYPYVQGWASRVGHGLAWCINPLNKFLRLFHPSGSQLEWDDDGNEDHQAAGDRNLEVAGDSTTIYDGSVDETFGAETTRSYAEKVKETCDDEYIREATGAVTETTKVGHTIDAPKISLGSKSSAEPLVLGTAFMTYYNTHQHLGNMGVPTGPPLVPMSGAHVSTKAFTEI